MISTYNKAWVWLKKYKKFISIGIIIFVVHDYRCSKPNETSQPDIPGPIEITSNPELAEIQLKFPVDENATYYTIFRKDSRDGPFNKTDTLEYNGWLFNVYYIDNDVRPGSRYFYGVTACQSGYCSEMSAIVSDSLGEYSCKCSKSVKIDWYVTYCCNNPACNCAVDSTVITGLMHVQKGEKVTDASTYDPAAAGFHPVVIKGDSGYIDEMNFCLPSGWFPASSAEWEIALVIDTNCCDENVFAYTCYYEDNHKVHWYKKYTGNIYVWEVRTNTLVDTIKILGAVPVCSSTEYFYAYEYTKWSYGEDPGFNIDTLINLARPYVE